MKSAHRSYGSQPWNGCHGDYDRAARFRAWDCNAYGLFALLVERPDARDGFGGVSCRRLEHHLSFFFICTLAYFYCFGAIFDCAVQGMQHITRKCAQFGGPGMDQSTVGAPSTKTFSSPGANCVQVSLVVSGAVTITATRSLGVVTSEKSTLMSSSDNLAVANGYWRTM